MISGGGGSGRGRPRSQGKIGGSRRIGIVVGVVAVGGFGEVVSEIVVEVFILFFFFGLLDAVVDDEKGFLDGGHAIKNAGGAVEGDQVHVGAGGVLGLVAEPGKQKLLGDGVGFDLAIKGGLAGTVEAGQAVGRGNMAGSVMGGKAGAKAGRRRKRPQGFDCVAGERAWETTPGENGEFRMVNGEW